MTSTLQEIPLTNFEYRFLRPASTMTLAAAGMIAGEAPMSIVRPVSAAELANG
jgi:hypothetical protein